MDRNLNTNRIAIQPADFSHLERMFKKALSRNQHCTNVIIQLLRRRMPIHFGGMSDPFQPIERSLKVSLKTLNLLQKYHYPTIISTKSALLIERRYLKILEDMDNLAVQITLISSSEQATQKLEPNAPSVEKRLELFAKLSEHDIWTSCRMQPLIPKVNDEDYELIDKLAAAGCEHVIVEHYKMPTYSSLNRRKMMNDACSYDIESYYRRSCSKPRGMFFELPSSDKVVQLRKLVAHIHEKNMTFGAADNDFHDLGDSTCCCGVDGLPGFQNIHLRQNVKAVMDGKESGRIRYSSIENEWCSEGSVREIVNAHCRLQGCKDRFARSIRDFVETKWNSPYSNNAPTDMANVVPSDEVDDSGHITYKYSNKFTIKA